MPPNSIGCFDEANDTSSASGPRYPKSGHRSDPRLIHPPTALQAGHMFEPNFPIRPSGPGSIPWRPSCEHLKPDFCIVRLGSLATSADKCVTGPTWQAVFCSHGTIGDSDTVRIPQLLGYSDKHNADLCVRPPLCAAMAAGAVNDQIKVLRDTNCRRYQ